MRVLQVSEFIEIVNGVLRETLGAERIGVEGEVSGFKISGGQWVSFDLKDEKSLLNVFLPVWDLKIPVEDGMRVRVFGLPRVYPRYGRFSLSAERIELAGEGALKKALALLRARLDAEGLFDPSRKRALPRFPKRIALVASRESAAYGDFVQVLKERWGGLEIDLYHVLVQGDRAPQDILQGLRAAQAGAYDALVMTRGGGSLEELMAFNDEQVVRAIHTSKIPTLVAIGHERDITLAEEAADVRGSTPTDCARRLVPDRRDVQYELAAIVSGIDGKLSRTLEERKRVLDHAVTAPMLWLSNQRTGLQRLISVCLVGMRQWQRRLGEKLEANLRLLSSLDPRQVLARGFALVQDAQGRIVTRVSALHPGDRVTVRLKDGEAGAAITHVGQKTAQQKLL